MGCRGAEVPNLEVEVPPGRMPGRARVALGQRLTAHDALSWTAAIPRGRVCVPAFETEPVRDRRQVAVAARIEAGRPPLRRGSGSPSAPGSRGRCAPGGIQPNRSPIAPGTGLKKAHRPDGRRRDHRAQHRPRSSPSLEPFHRPRRAQPPGNGAPRLLCSARAPVEPTRLEAPLVRRNWSAATSPATSLAHRPGAREGLPRRERRPGLRTGDPRPRPGRAAIETCERRPASDLDAVHRMGIEPERVHRDLQGGDVRAPGAGCGCEEQSRDRPEQGEELGAS